MQRSQRTFLRTYLTQLPLVTQETQPAATPPPQSATLA